MADVDKHIDKGEALLAKNKLDGALEEFKAAYEGAKGNLNLLQQIADLCLRLDRKDEAAQYYGDLFDMACGKGDLKRASVIFPKLQDTPQPPERYAKYAALLVNNKKNPEAFKAYDAAIAMYEKAGNGDGVLGCLEGMVRLDPDKAEIQIRLGEQADKMGKAELAANGLLRGGQLIRPDDAGKAAECFRRAHDLKPDRSTALNLAEVLAERNESGAVISLLQPLYASGEKDPAVMETLGGALVAQNRMDEAEKIIMALQDVKPESFVLLFELTRHH